MHQFPSIVERNTSKQYLFWSRNVKYFFHIIWEIRNQNIKEHVFLWYTWLQKKHSPVYSVKAVKAVELALTPSLLQIYLSLQILHQYIVKNKKRMGLVRLQNFKNTTLISELITDSGFLDAEGLCSKVIFPWKYRSNRALTG